MLIAASQFANSVTPTFSKLSLYSYLETQTLFLNPANNWQMFSKLDIEEVNSQQEDFAESFDIDTDEYNLKPKAT